MSLGYVLIYFIAAGSSAIVALDVWRHRSIAGGLTLAILMVALSVWAFFSGLTELSTSLDGKLLLVKIYFLSIVPVPFCILVIALQAGGYDRWLTRKYLLLMAVVPGLTLAAVWTNALHHQFWTEVHWVSSPHGQVAEFVHGPLYWLWILAAYTTLVAGLIIFIKSLWAAPQLFRYQSIAIAAAIATPLIGNLMYLFGVTPWPDLDTTCLGFVISGMAISWGLTRLRLFDVVPVAREAVLKSMSDVVLVLDRLNRVVDCNRATMTFFQQPESEIVAQPVGQLFPASPDVVQHLTDGELASLETSIDINGTLRHCDLRITLINDHKNNAIGQLVVIRDVTVERRAARELQSELERSVALRTTQLNESEEKLRQLQRLDAVGQLAGGIAHDFNNLLTAINGYTDLLLKNVEAGHPWHQSLSQIRSAGSRATLLTSQLLAFSRKQILQPRVIDLGDIVSVMETMLRRLIGEHIDLTVSTAPKLHRVMADPSQMDQVVMNLIVNARDAMPDGGRVSVDIRNVTLDAASASLVSGLEPGDYVRLTVSDSGIGMAPDTLAHIFEPFFTTKGVDQGTGLGLSTVFGILKQSGGGIEVVSGLGVGSTFRVFLPKSELEESAESDPLTPDRRAHGTEVVLLVEDEELILVLLKRTLETHGYRVLAAGNGVEALRLASRHRSAIHLLVTDVVMPQMNGPELVRRIRPLRPNLAVLFMSGYNEAMVANQSQLDPDQYFLQKPIDIKTFVDKVRSILDASRIPDGVPGPAPGRA